MLSISRPRTEKAATSGKPTSKVRVTTPKYIEISISNEKISFPDENHATVTFHQSYRSDYLNTSFDKVMLLVKSNNKWLIQEERAAK